MTPFRGGIASALEDLHRIGWFFRGFASGRDPARDETAGQHLAVENAIEAVREWMAGLLDGKWRILAPGETISYDGRHLKTRTLRDDGGLVIVTYAELESIYDGLRGFRGSYRHKPTDADKALAFRTMHTIMQEIRDQQAPMHDVDDEKPF